mgnify:CR=1 FL=1
MRSFAVWYKPSNHYNSKGKNINGDNRIPKDQIHVNFWSQIRDKLSVEKCFFDFGIYVDDIRKVDTIYLYCPFEVDKNDVHDLGSRLSSDGLVCALFNENYAVTNGYPKRFFVDCNGCGDNFIIYSLMEDSEISIEYCRRDKIKPDFDKAKCSGKGSIICMKVDGLHNNSKSDIKEIYRYYFRIRVIVDKFNLNLITQKINGESIFSDSFTSTEVMDFRLNDIRSCCSEVKDRFKNGTHFNFKSIHYLVMRDAENKVLAEGNTYACRLLEHDIWQQYVDCLKENIMAYHFKKVSNGNKSAGNLVVVTRFKTKRSNWITILGAFVVALLLGVLGNIFSVPVIKWLSKIGIIS